MRDRRIQGQGRLNPERIGRSLMWRGRLATSSRRALPDFVVVGAQRAGTTSLFEHLVGHPQVVAPHRKEIHYYDLHHSRGVGWYRGQLPADPLAGERSHHR